MVNKMINYEKSFDELKRYLKKEKKIPSEKVWNRYAYENGLLSSKTMEYVYGVRFNKMCREMNRKKKKQN